jgi:hypothetical protein
MDITKQIIDMRVTKLAKDNYADLSMDKAKAKAFVLLVVSTHLSIDEEEANDYIVDGSGDGGIDAMYYDYPTGNNNFNVLLFQGKYTKDLDKDSNFSANAVQKMVDVVRTIFDAGKDVSAFNSDVCKRIDDIRSYISEGYIPNIKVILCNNGLKWNDEGQQYIDNAKFPGDQIVFDYVNHDDIVKHLTSKKEKGSIKLQFSGKSISEDYDNKRVFLGKVNVMEIYKLFKRYGDTLLEKNVRKYLGLGHSNVNRGIKETLLGEHNDDFYFKNNGITMVCSEFEYNAFQNTDHIVTIRGLQIINGGQTCKTIEDTIAENQLADFKNAFVLVRLYKLNESDSRLVDGITLATNNQNPVDLSDLHSNDEIQRKLEFGIRELGYTYITKKGEKTKQDDNTFSMKVAASAICSTLARMPHIAKSKQKDLFNDYYSELFTDKLNPAQVILAVLVSRFVDNMRRKKALNDRYPHLYFSSYYVTYIVWNLFERSVPIMNGKDVTRQTFEDMRKYFVENQDLLFREANMILEASMEEKFSKNYEGVDRRELAAEFRRGYLLAIVDKNIENNPPLPMQPLIAAKWHKYDM